MVLKWKHQVTQKSFIQKLAHRHRHIFDREAVAECCTCKSFQSPAAQSVACHPYWSQPGAPPHIITYSDTQPAPRTSPTPPLRRDRHVTGKRKQTAKLSCDKVKDRTQREKDAPHVSKVKASCSPEIQVWPP